MARHLQTIAGDERVSPGQPRHGFTAPGQREHQGERQLQARRAAADIPCDLGQHLAEQHVLPAENVSLPDPSALERGEMARRDIVDMGKVEPGIHEPRHSARCSLHDHPAGRCRLDVTRPDRGRRIDDHGRKTAGLDQISHHALRQYLAALVGADRLLDAERAGLVGGRAVAAKRQRGHAAGINHALDAGPKRLLHDDAGAFHVDAQQVVGNGRPQSVIGGRVDEVADARERGGDRAAIPHVAFHHLTTGVDEIGAHTGASHQRPHRITGAPERLHDGGSDEPACACDQDGAGMRTGRLNHHATGSLGKPRRRVDTA